VRRSAGSRAGRRPATGWRGSGGHKPLRISGCLRPPLPAPPGRATARREPSQGIRVRRICQRHLPDPAQQIRSSRPRVVKLPDSRPSRVRTRTHAAPENGDNGETEKTGHIGRRAAGSRAGRRPAMGRATARREPSQGIRVRRICQLHLLASSQQIRSSRPRVVKLPAVSPVRHLHTPQACLPIPGE
jgi:hypothetical protein